MTRSFTNRVFRFAPSSNGYLHLGHAYSALLNSAMARAVGGRLLLRIEDIDVERCRFEFEQQHAPVKMPEATPFRQRHQALAEVDGVIAQLPVRGELRIQQLLQIAFLPHRSAFSLDEDVTDSPLAQIPVQRFEGRAGWEVQCGTGTGRRRRWLRSTGGQH